MGYSIGEFSSITGVSIYTLRYYEQENLIFPDRKENGRRCYSDADISWIQFIKRLRDTDMAIKEIQKYAQLRAAGDCTLQERLEILLQHQVVLKQDISKMQEHLANLEDKIKYYITEMKEER